LKACHGTFFLFFYGATNLLSPFQDVFFFPNSCWCFVEISSFSVCGIRSGPLIRLPCMLVCAISLVVTDISFPFLSSKYIGVLFWGGILTRDRISWLNSPLLTFFFSEIQTVAFSLSLSLLCFSVHPMMIIVMPYPPWASEVLFSFPANGFPVPFHRARPPGEQNRPRHSWSVYLYF